MAHTNSSQSAGGAGRTVQPPTLYFPLALDQTRVLTILPASSMDNDIFSELTTVFLKEIAVHGYEALSYTWGSETLTHSISVNDFPLKITTNLFEAMRHLRHKKLKRTLWIDAVCINQGDLAERSRQILHMKQIFSTVERVIIWLGGEDYSSALAPAIPPGDMKKLNSNQQRAVTAGIFERQWWLRSWTVQEFLHAKTSVFVCGSIILSWVEVTELMDTFENNFHSRTAYDHIRSFVRSKNSHKEDLLRTVMSDFGHSQVTDPRDKVFAFLGIANDGHEFVPDYTASVRKVYTDLVEMYIKKDHHIDIICAHHRGRTKLELPSWVPDWSISRMSAQNWIIDSMASSLYSAGFMPKSEKPNSIPPGPINPIVTRSTISTTLNVCGADIGLISEMTCCFDPVVFETDAWMAEICSWKPKDVESGTYFNAESNFRAFCRTLVADLAGILRYTSLEKWNKEKGSSRLKRLEEELRGVFSGRVSGSSALSLWLQKSTYLSRFARLSSGHMALVPRASVPGDHICILRGGSVPMGLRRSQPPLPSPTNPILDTTPTYQMIGPCYVHGVMDGEMFGKIESQFVII